MGNVGKMISVSMCVQFTTLSTINENSYFGSAFLSSHPFFTDGLSWRELFFALMLDGKVRIVGGK